MIRRYQGALAVCALLIGYASLYPFVPLRAPGEDAIGVFFKPRYFAFDFVLNVLAFILVGFQLKSINERVNGATGARYVAVAAVVCVAVILARIAWVTGAAAYSRWAVRFPSSKRSRATARASALPI